MIGDRCPVAQKNDAQTSEQFWVQIMARSGHPVAGLEIGLAICNEYIRCQAGGYWRVEFYPILILYFDLCKYEGGTW